MVQHPALDPEHGGSGSVTEPQGAPYYGVEHRLNVGGGARDDTQDLGRCRLLLQRLGQVTVTDLELLEEPHVLEGDDRLVGKGLEQLDLLVAEGRGLQAPGVENTDKLAVTEHGHRQDAARTLDRV
jgi:hypothetical protein